MAQGKLVYFFVGTANWKSFGSVFLERHKWTFTTNTICQIPTQKKTTWQHPRSKHWHTLAYYIVRQRDHRDVLIMCSMPGQCQLIISRLNIRTHRCSRIQHTVAKKLDLHKLKDLNGAKAYSEAVKQRLEEILPTPASELSTRYASLYLTNPHQSLGSGTSPASFAR